MSEQAAQSIFDLALVRLASRCLHVVAELGVADALGDEPQSAAALASKLDLNGKVLHRVMRALSNHGVFELKNGQFVHNAASRLLRTNEPGSMRSLVRLLGNNTVWDAYRELGQTVKTGQPGIEFVVKGGLFAYLEAHPEDARVFDEAMTGKAFGQIGPVLGAYDFSGLKTIGDIGGGAGHLLYAVLEKAPAAKGVLFDLPQVIARAKAAANPRVTYIGGDFFKDAIPPCDAYMMMTVLHDWSDKESATILTRIAKTAPKGAKLLLIESVIDEAAQGDVGMDLDIEMLAMTTGRERTKEEWASVIADGGFRLTRIVPTGGFGAVVEAVRA
jgi:hypothetical protein